MIYSLKLNEFIKELSLFPIYMPEDGDEREIFSAEINRAGLLLSGFTEHFERQRVQICGNVEVAYINSLRAEERARAIDLLFKYRPPAVVISGSHSVNFDFSPLIPFAKEYSVPLLHSTDTTSNFMASAISYLSVELAPRITRHGVLVEVFGEGILILGNSGIGKSEAAIELVKRGHRFVADDAVELRKVSNRTIVGMAPENIRNFIELRGIGVVNVRRIFGMGAIKLSERIDLVIELKHWVKDKTYDRVGFEDETIDILGVRIPKLTIPVMPGRNLAVIFETAAMNNREKKMGYNSAKELMEKLGLESY